MKKDTKDIKKMKTNEIDKILIYRDQSKIDAFQNSLEKTLPVLQNFVNAFTSSVHNDPKTSLNDMIFNFDAIEARYVEKLVNEHNITSGLPIKLKVNSFEPIDSSLRLLAESVRTEIERNHTDIKYFTLDNGKVSINSGSLNRFIESNSVYANTPETVELYNKWIELGKITQAFDNLLKENFNSYFLPKGLYPVPLARFFRFDADQNLVLRLDVYKALCKKIGISEFFNIPE
jgi:hypothetical protein